MPLAQIRTARVLLRPWQPSDIDALHQLWTTPEVRRYLWDDVVISREAVQQAVESHLKTVDRYNIGYWALHIPAQSQPRDAPIAGFCGFRLIDDGPEIELMYGLRGEHWGKGFATEACAAAIEYLWNATSYRQVYARTDPPNQRSVQVMLRLGMTHHSTTDDSINYLMQRPG